MRVQKFFLWIILAFLTGTTSVVGQDAHFSQYLNADLYLNPALSSAPRKTTFSFNYRSQWGNLVSSPYATTQVSALIPVYLGTNYKKLGGIAASFYSDKSPDGIMKETGGIINASYNLQLGALHSIYLGLQGGFIQKSINYSKLKWGAQYTPVGYDATKDPDLESGNLSRMAPDFTAGFVYAFNPEKDYSRHGSGYSSKIGLAVYHMNTPNQSFFPGDKSAKLPMMLKAYGELEVNVANNFYLIPNVLYQSQADAYQLNTGLSINYHLKHKQNSPIRPHSLLGGLLYRYNDSFIFMVGMNNQFYSLGFSYDMTTTFKNYSYNTGAYEIALKLSPFKEKKGNSYFYYHKKQ